MKLTHLGFARAPYPPSCHYDVQPSASAMTRNISSVRWKCPAEGSVNDWTPPRTICGNSRMSRGARQKGENQKSNLGHPDVLTQTRRASLHPSDRPASSSASLFAFRRTCCSPRCCCFPDASARGRWPASRAPCPKLEKVRGPARTGPEMR